MGSLKDTLKPFNEVIAIHCQLNHVCIRHGQAARVWCKLWGYG